MSSMEPQTFDAVFGIFYYIIADLSQNFCLRKLEPAHIDFQHFNVFAGCQCTSDIAEEIVQNSLSIEMSIAETFQLDVCYLNISSFIDVIFELSEFAFGTEKFSTSDVQLGHLCGIEDQCHFKY